MKVKCILDIYWDAEEITTEEIIDFLSNCGEDVNTDVKVLSIKQLEEE